MGIMFSSWPKSPSGISLSRSAPAAGGFGHLVPRPRVGRFDPRGEQGVGADAELSYECSEVLPANAIHRHAASPWRAAQQLSFGGTGRMSLTFLLPGKWDMIPDGVEFTTSNDHNPEVETECGRCGGTGHELLDPKIQCPSCKGTGRAAVRFFKNEAPTMDAELSASGLCKCPCCGFRFSVADRRRWTGLRHARCGQKIRLLRYDAEPDH